MKPTMLIISVLLFVEVGIAAAAPRSDRAVTDVTASIVRYNAEEALLGEGMMAPPRLLGHWKRLTLIRTQLERLPSSRTWRTGERVALRHVLAQLFGQVVLVDSARGWIERSIAVAATRRRGDLDAIARWSNRRLDFALERGLAGRLDDFPLRSQVAGATASR